MTQAVASQYTLFERIMVFGSQDRMVNAKNFSRDAVAEKIMVYALICCEAPRPETRLMRW